MKPIDLFLPKVHQFAPGVSDPVAYEWIVQAAIEFCERTRAWTDYDQYPLSGIDPSGVVAPVGAVIHEIAAVTFNDVQLEPTSPAQLDMAVPHWRSGRARGLPIYFTQMTPNTIAVAPLQAGLITAWLTLKPAPDATMLPDFLADQHRQVIADGALSRILALPGQPFSNPEMAQTMLAAFQYKLTTLATKGSTGQQRARLRTKSRMF